MPMLPQEIRHAARSLARSPAFSIAAVLSLALGIGANTAIFSVVNGVLLRPAPFVEADRLAIIWQTDRSSGSSHEPSSVPDFRDMRERTQHFERLAAFSPVEVNVTSGTAEKDPARVAALGVSPEYFATLGLEPLVGRMFTTAEDTPGGPRAVVISEDLWERNYNRQASAIGSTLRVNDIEWEIVGVMPRGSDFGVLQVLGAADYNRGFVDRGGRPQVDVWAPLRSSPDAPRSNHPIFVVGRLAGSLPVAAAHDEMVAIMADLERAYPEANEARGANVQSFEDVVFGEVRVAMLVLVAAVGMVLLVACANVGNLLLVRAANRAHEVTVRTALGASLGRLARQFTMEVALLVGAGAVLGTLLALGAVQALGALAPATIPRAGEIGIDMAALGVTLGISVIVALVLGLLPTLHARRPNLQAAMQASGARGSSGGRWARSLRSAFVIGELAMATMLMVGSGLLIRSLWTLQSVDPGFEAARVLKAEFQLPLSRYPRDFDRMPDWPERQRFAAELESRLMAMPGVQAVALATANPMDIGFTSSIRVVGREAEAGEWPEPSIRMVSASYFGTLHVALRAGRGFESTDHAASAPVMVINESARERYFRGHEPIGAQINLWGVNRTIVGVVGNERFKGLAADAPPAVYMPLTQAPMPSAVLVRMRGDASLAIPLVREAVRGIDPELALFGVEPLEVTISGTLAERRFTMLVLAAFALAALTLAAIGVYGVLSYAVAQRTREIGIRVALGADLARVRRLVLSDGGRLAAVGVALGLAGALALGRVMRSLLYGIGATDPATFAGVAALLGVVALVACWLPARRAAQVDPVEALRAD